MPVFAAPAGREPPLQRRSCAGGEQQGFMAGAEWPGLCGHNQGFGNRVTLGSYLASLSLSLLLCKMKRTRVPSQGHVTRA